MLLLTKSFKSKNYQDYFKRKITYDMQRNKYEKLSDDEIKEELHSLERIITVQNMYTDVVKFERGIQMQNCGR